MVQALLGLQAIFVRILTAFKQRQMHLGLRKGQQVQLAFAINLGLVTKIHRRTAIVAHVTRGGTGLMMEQFAGR